MTLLSIAYWVCVLIPTYVFAGYPILLAFIARLGRNFPPKTSDKYEPSVSILIAAYNEEKNIDRAIGSAARQEYPNEKLEILVGSDGSSDRTAAIVSDWSRRDSRIKLFQFPRQGKAATMNALVSAARGEIAIQTDAFAFAEPDWARKIVRNFLDPAVGYVAGGLRMVNADASTVARSEGFYFKYELLLRDLESRAGVLAVGCGPCNAFRRVLYRPIPSIGDIDNSAPLQAIGQGYRAVQDSEAWVYEEVSEQPRQQLRARTRQISRSLRDILRFPRLLNPFLYPGVAFSLWSHRLLRWATPLFLIPAWLLNAALAVSNPFYRVLLTAQCFFYGTGAVSCWLGKYIRLPRLVSLPGGFLTANVAMARGLINAAVRREIRTWRD